MVVLLCTITLAVFPAHVGRQRLGGGRGALGARGADPGQAAAAATRRWRFRPAGRAGGDRQESGQVRQVQSSRPPGRWVRSLARPCARRTADARTPQYGSGTRCLCDKSLRAANPRECGGRPHARADPLRFPWFPTLHAVPRPGRFRRTTCPASPARALGLGHAAGAGKRLRVEPGLPHRGGDPGVAAAGRLRPVGPAARRVCRRLPLRLRRDAAVHGHRHRPARRAAHRAGGLSAGRRRRAAVGHGAQLRPAAAGPGADRRRMRAGLPGVHGVRGAPLSGTALFRHLRNDPRPRRHRHARHRHAAGLAGAGQHPGAWRSGCWRRAGPWPGC